MRRPSPRARRIVVYVALVGLAAFGLLRQQQSVDELHALIEAEEVEERVEEAVRCVSSWEVREQIRQSDEDHGEAAGEALIEVVQPDDPVIVDRYRTVLAEHLHAASDEVEDPDCDLEAAQAIVRAS